MLSNLKVLVTWLICELIDMGPYVCLTSLFFIVTASVSVCFPLLGLFASFLPMLSSILTAQRLPAQHHIVGPFNIFFVKRSEL